MRTLFCVCPCMQTFKIIFGSNERSSVGYEEFFWRALWIGASIIAVTYASYLYFGSVNAAYFGEPAPIPILDILSKEGEHHLSGDIPVPSSCHGLTVTTKALSETHFQLEFITWQEPTLSCEPLGYSRTFNTVVFAPSTGITFSARIDGEEVPIRITKRF